MNWVTRALLGILPAKDLTNSDAPSHPAPVWPISDAPDPAELAWERETRGAFDDSADLFLYEAEADAYNRFTNDL